MGREEMSDTRIQRPGLYYPKMRTNWWLSRPGYIRFMIREATSVFIAIFLIEFLMLVRAVGQGPDPYAAFVGMLASPGCIVFNAVALVFALYHTVTWFKLTGVVQVVQIGDKRVPPALIVAGAFAAWGVVSLFLLYWIVVRS
jgi:fumarate reductase subunit C